MRAAKGDACSPRLDLNFPAEIWCKHMFVSLTDLHFALRAKDAERSIEEAARLDRVPLRYALRVALLLADRRDPRYEAVASEFLRQVLTELRPPLIEMKKLTDALAHVHHYHYGHFARLALQDVLGQLHRIEQKVNVKFDSLAR